MAEVLGNRYEMIKLIGRGGMADVYLALDTILNREVAIKILKPELSAEENSLERFSREAIASTQLTHSNIVDVYDVGDDEDKHYIVMEYVKGHTLKQLLKKRGPIPYKEAVWMIKQLAGALMEAHRKGMIHRDVKSQNVLIKDDGTIKLTDFGIALAQGDIQITGKDSILGSVHYLAPEITRGQVATMQSDIYSLGIVFYELLTGDVPYKGDSAVQIALKHIKDNIKSVRDFDNSIPQSVENIIIKATAKNLENRYKNIALMIKDLNNCLKDEYRDCPKLVLNSELERKTIESIHISDTAKRLKTKKKKKDKAAPFSIAFLVIVIVSSIGIIGLVLFMSGLIGINRKTYVPVPDIVGLSVLDASDLLDEHGLILDTVSSNWQMSDTYEKGIIISSRPGKDTLVERNTKITATVSEGLYKTLKNYKNQKYTDVKDELTALGFRVSLVEKQDSSVNSGLVISTEPTADSQYNPNESNSIIVYYSSYPTVLLSTDLKGISIEAMKNYLDDLNLVYEFDKVDKSFFKEIEVDGISQRCVVSTEPNLGLEYKQTENSKIVVYYYEESEE